jgi:hypothetical protein
MPAPVVLSGQVGREPWTPLTDYGGGTTAIYAGMAYSRQPESTLPVTSVSTAAAAVVTSAAHGLATDNGVTISGATGDWAALNGTRAITVTGTNTFTIAVNSTGFTGTFNGRIATTAPQTSKAQWQIDKYYYDVTGNLQIRTGHANGTTQANNIWDNRASLIYA